MKRLFTAFILCVSVIRAEDQKPEANQQETLTQKVERFKKENPYTYRILKTYFINEDNKGSYSGTLYLRDITMKMHDEADSDYIQLETKINEEDTVLEVEKESLRSVLRKVIAQKTIKDSHKPIDNCTKCGYSSYQRNCVSYIPRDVYEEIKNEEIKTPLWLKGAAVVGVVAVGAYLFSGRNN